MGKTPRTAVGGLFVAVLMLAGCSTPSQTIATPGTTAQQQWKGPGQAWSGQPTNAGTGLMAQNASTGLNGGQPTNAAVNTRPQTGQTFGSPGNFQNGYASNGQQSTGFNQIPGTSNVQPVTYGQNQFGAGVQQAGGWSTNAQPAGTSANRNMGRATDDSTYSGSGISASTPPPVFPSANGSGSNDPPPVSKSGSVNYNTRYDSPLPFQGTRSGNQ